MKKYILVLSVLVLFGCDKGDSGCHGGTSESKDSKAVQKQQGQYLKAQPIPYFNESLERHLLIELQKVRNNAVSTHSVWRGDTSVIEGDCPSMGYGIPYDTSLTNPLVATDIDNEGEENAGGALTSIEQPEPNGVFASKNTAATWVFCLAKDGTVAPVYIEAKVSVYPGTVKVDYTNNRVIQSGVSNVLIRVK